MSSEWVSVRQVAYVLKLDRRTILNWISYGWLPFVRVGPKLWRIKRVDAVAIAASIKKREDDFLNEKEVREFVKQFKFPTSDSR